MHILGLLQIWPSLSIAAMLLSVEHATKALVTPADSKAIKQILATWLGLGCSSISSTKIEQTLPLLRRLRRLGLRETRHFCEMGTIHLRRFYTCCDHLGIDKDKVIDMFDWDFFLDNGL